MKVLLLAAGRSLRMRPIEDKNFLDFLGKPLIWHQLEMLKKNGFDDVVIVGRDNNIERLREVGEALEMKIEIVEQSDFTGMCGAILAAEDLIGSEPVLIFSSNDVVDENALELIKMASNGGKADGYLLAKKVSNYFPGGYLKLDEDGFIEFIQEKPEPGTEPSDLVNLVVHAHMKPAVLIEYLKKVKSENDDLYEKALSEMIKDGVKMQPVEYEGFWQPIKFPWHVQKVFRYFFDKAEKFVAESAVVDKNAVIEGDVIIDENVKLMAGAVVNGPCYLGKGTIVATNSLVRESNVGANCVIGFSTEVARSHLGDDVWTHSNYIGDSVIGNNVSFGAGTVTGNLRLDEAEIVVKSDDKEFSTGSPKFGLVTGDDIRVGINTSFMPGVKIGSKSFIGAGIVVAENVPEKSFVRGKWEIKISENTGEIPKRRSL